MSLPGFHVPREVESEAFSKPGVGGEHSNLLMDVVVAAGLLFPGGQDLASLSSVSDATVINPLMACRLVATGGRLTRACCRVGYEK